MTYEEERAFAAMVRGAGPGEFVKTHKRQKPDAQRQPHAELSMEQILARVREVIAEGPAPDLDLGIVDRTPADRPRPFAVAGLPRLNRKQEVDAAVREGMLNMWGDEFSARRMMVGLANDKYGIADPEINAIRAAWRSQHA